MAVHRKAAVVCQLHRLSFLTGLLLYDCVRLADDSVRPENPPHQICQRHLEYLSPSSWAVLSHSAECGEIWRHEIQTGGSFSSRQTRHMRHVHRCMVATCGENGLLQYWLLRRERSPKQSDTGRSGMFVSSPTPPPRQHMQFERHADSPSHRPIYFDHFQKNVRYCLPRHQRRK